MKFSFTVEEFFTIFGKILHQIWAWVILIKIIIIRKVCNVVRWPRLLVAMEKCSYCSSPYRLSLPYLWMRWEQNCCSQYHSIISFYHFWGGCLLEWGPYVQISRQCDFIILYYFCIFIILALLSVLAPLKIASSRGPRPPGPHQPGRHWLQLYWSPEMTLLSPYLKIFLEFPPSLPKNLKKLIPPHLKSHDLW